MNRLKTLLTIAAIFIFTTNSFAKKIDVLLITGDTDKWHSWEVMSSTLEGVLAQYDIFETKISKMVDGVEFTPCFDGVDVVIVNVNDTTWSDQTKRNFENYVANGGGVVIVHEADNAFPEWKEYNKMIGLGGWGGRNEKDGPYYYWKDGEFVYDTTPGVGGGHGKRVPFDINVRNSKHPIMKGLPAKWTHYNDELYGNLRGPAENIDVLATGFSTAETGGSGKEEPVLFTISYGKGRIFHTVLGHTTKEFRDAVENNDFQVTFSRGTEWAATGKVKQKNKIDF